MAPSYSSLAGSSKTQLNLPPAPKVLGSNTGTAPMSGKRKSPSSDTEVEPGHSARGDAASSGSQSLPSTGRVKPSRQPPRSRRRCHKNENISATTSEDASQEPPGQDTETVNPVAGQPVPAPTPAANSGGAINRICWLCRGPAPDGTEVCVHPVTEGCLSSENNEAFGDNSPGEAPGMQDSTRYSVQRQMQESADWGSFCPTPMPFQNPTFPTCFNAFDGDSTSLMYMGGHYPRYGGTQYSMGFTGALGSSIPYQPMQGMVCTPYGHGMRQNCTNLNMGQQFTPISTQQLGRGVVVGTRGPSGLIGFTSDGSGFPGSSRTGGN